MQIVNDNARLTTPLLRPGAYELGFWYHAEGNQIGVLNVYTRAQGSEYLKLIWYHSSKFNTTVTDWTNAVVDISETTNFEVSHAASYVTIIVS